MEKGLGIVVGSIQYHILPPQNIFYSNYFHLVYKQRKTGCRRGLCPHKLNRKQIPYSPLFSPAPVAVFDAQPELRRCLRLGELTVSD